MYSVGILFSSPFQQLIQQIGRLLLKEYIAIRNHKVVVLVRNDLYPLNIHVWNHIYAFLVPKHQFSIYSFLSANLSTKGNTSSTLPKSKPNPYTHKHTTTSIASENEFHDEFPLLIGLYCRTYVVVHS